MDWTHHILQQNLSEYYVVGTFMEISETKSLPKSTEWNNSKLHNYCGNLDEKNIEKNDSVFFINMGKYMYIWNQYGLC